MRDVRTISEFEERFGIPWKSTCAPLSPEISRRIDSHYELKAAVKSLWRKSGRPEYPDDVSISSFKSSSDVSLFGNGGYLVRNNGDRVDLNADTFKGKYVFVCCFHVPMYYGQDLLDLCNELCSTRDDVEVVMVAWMKSLVDADDPKQVFDHFFLGFHRSCLAVPFEDFKQRAYLSKFVHDYKVYALINERCNYTNYLCLVLDSQGMVLPTYTAGAIYYGAAAFPFTYGISSYFKTKDEQLKKDNSLERLLLIDGYFPDVVYKFNRDGGGPREEVRISELNNKLVGLYFPCQHGNLFPTLVKVYEQCMKKQLEFEVVVVYKEEEESHLNRKHYQEKIDRLILQNNDTCRHWWCLPLIDPVSSWLSRILPPYTNLHESDRLCVVGPAGRFVDYGPGLVMKKYGIDGYPFSKEGIVHTHESKMREITLESVLLGDDVFEALIVMISFLRISF